MNVISSSLNMILKYFPMATSVSMALGLWNTMTPSVQAAIPGFAQRGSWVPIKWAVLCWLTPAEVTSQYPEHIGKCARNTAGQRVSHHLYNVHKKDKKVTFIVWFFFFFPGSYGQQQNGKWTGYWSKSKQDGCLNQMLIHSVIYCHKLYSSNRRKAGDIGGLKD